MAIWHVDLTLVLVNPQVFSSQSDSSGYSTL